MSRWREMLMDYGQMFDDGRAESNKSSEFFSVDGDLEDMNKTDMELRRSLEVYFRPLFQRYVYGGEKVACHDIRRILIDPEYRDRLPPEKVQELADITDFNKGKSVTYSEFVRIVMGRTHAEDAFSFDSDSDFGGGGGGNALNKSRFQADGVLPVICRNTIAQEMVEDHVRGYRCLPPAFFMVAVSLAQIVIYALYASEDVGRNLQPLSGLPVDNALWYSPERRREAWRFVTYCFLHDGYVDLIFNLLLQLVLGVPLEIIFSFWRVMIVYFCGVITGSLGQSLVDRYVGLAGAAGGAYAVTAAHVVGMIENWSSLNTNERDGKIRHIACSVPVRILVIAVFATAQVALAVYRRWFYSHSPLVGIAAHAGGIIAGAVLGRAFLKDNKRYPCAGGAGYLNLFLFLFFIGFCVIFNIVYYDYPVEAYP